MYTFREFYIPERMMKGIELYLKYGVIPGDFLFAVLNNDLKEAVGRADDENLRNLPAYIGYFYNEAPAGSWGSVENVNNYLGKLQEQENTERANGTFKYREWDEDYQRQRKEMENELNERNK